MIKPQKSLVIGSGECALQTARHLASAGVPVIVAAGRQKVSLPVQDEPNSARAAGIDIIADTRLAACEGFAGGFKTVLTSSGHQTTHSRPGISPAQRAC